jgi:hypothetical protein
MNTATLQNAGRRASATANNGFSILSNHRGAIAVLAIAVFFTFLANSTRGEAISGTGIGTFPCTISSSGLYHLTSNNAQFNGINRAAILIQLSAAQKDRDVVLDLNDHTITQTNRQYSMTGSAYAWPIGIKIATTGKGRVTVRNGTLVGFAVGIEINGGDQFLVENMTIVGPARSGISVTGSSKNGTIRNNRIIGTTDTVLGVYNHYGIYFYEGHSSGMRIMNNDIEDLTGASGFTVALYAYGDNFAFENNRIHNIKTQTGLDLTGYGMIVGGSGVTVVNSRISTVGYGLFFWQGGGHYRDNVVDDSLTPYSGGTNAGNNH